MESCGQISLNFVVDENEDLNFTPDNKQGCGFSPTNRVREAKLSPLCPVVMPMF